MINRMSGVSSRQMWWCGAVLLAGASMWGCVGAGVRRGALQDVNAVLNGFHASAARADMEGYVGRMSVDGVFLGTDASERWTREEFRVFCEPYFSQGRGWKYVPRDRHVAFSADGRTAWFDEILSNEAYGTLRGSGVLTLSGGLWRVEQYNLAMLVPNDVSEDVVQLIEARRVRPEPSDP